MFFVLLLCCQVSQKHRDWVHQVLVDDNMIWSNRLDLLSNKLTVMNDHPYDFMRGSLGLHIQETQRITGDRMELDLHNDDSVLFFQIGDPHPENLTVSVQPDEPSRYHVFWADLDAGSFGPWYWDIRRAGVGLSFFANSIGCDCVDLLLPSLIQGYIDQSVALEEYIFDSAIILDLVEEAREEGANAKKFNKYTTDGRIDLNEILNEEGKGILALTVEEEIQLERVLKEISFDAKILDQARRFGTGVSSRPAIRYVVALEDEMTEHSELVLIREVVDSLPLFPYANYFDNNAQRVEDPAKWIWGNPSPDPRYQAVQDGHVSFKVVGWNSYLQDIERDKVEDGFASGDYSTEDIVELAQEIGVSLYLAHTSAPLYDGRLSKPILHDILQKMDRDVITQRLSDMIEKDVLQLQNDYHLFRSLFEKKGSTLGIEYIGDVR